MLGWHVPRPDEAMLISGGKRTGTPFKIIIGHGSFVLPLRSRVSYLTLSMQEAEVAEECVTKQGIAVNVKAVIAFKVGADPEGIANAAQRFLGSEDKMSVLTGRIFAGHLRSIIGSMTVEEIIRERQRLAEEALEASKLEMSKIGLVVDALQIESIDDMGSGYIKALAAPHVAEVQRAARVAQAQADQASAEAEQLSQRKQAEYERQTAIARAGFKAETDKAQATAAQAGPLAEAQATQDVLDAQTELAQRNASLRQEQLVAEVLRPAQAEAQKIKILADAEADRLRRLSEAGAANDRVALDQQLIAQLPEMLRAAADSLQNANLTVLGGSDGLGDLVSGLAAQGLNLFEALRGSVGQPDARRGDGNAAASRGPNGADLAALTGGNGGSVAGPPQPRPIEEGRKA
ncbi:flotillin [Acidimicrobiaceae bacterium USS-CC1]|uniref:Flotillin n=1 Tax=Acidiferrimicrobium australe TaxID=2664430 RepID=A0ABW9QP98_9ACTN|nr:flotillin [Acidiferrimicrobium australe]